MKLQTTILPVILMLLLSSCIPSKSGTKSLALDTTRNTYTHEQSGFSFPPTVGRFQRDNDIKFYNDSGDNFSVPYNLLTMEEKCVVTIYIYPSLKDYSITPIPKLGQTPEWFLKERYDEAKTSIINMYRATVLSEGEYKQNRSFLNPSGKKGLFEWNTVGGEKVFSHLYLFTHKGWLVKYRFTYPAKYNLVIEPEIKEFIQSYKCP